MDLLNYRVMTIDDYVNQLMPIAGTEGGQIL